MALGLSQAELARLLYVSQSAVSKIEAGSIAPSRQTVTLLRTWLLLPDFRTRLEVAGYAHPYPQDVSEHAEPPVSPTGL